MRNIRELLSTLASMSYYSTGTDLLTDHSFPSYLQFVSTNSFSSAETRKPLQTLHSENILNHDVVRNE